MRLSGWTGVDIVVDSRGKGEYRLSDYPHQKSGSFSITPEKFGQLVQRIEPFRRQAVPFTEKSARQFIDQKWPKGRAFYHRRWSNLAPLVGSQLGPALLGRPRV